MKKRKAGAAFVSRILFCMLILVAMLLGAGRRELPARLLYAVRQEDKQLRQMDADTSDIDENLPDDEVVVWIKPGRSYSEYQQWRDNLRRRHGELNETKICGSCDTTLLLLKGRGIRDYIMGGTVGGGQVSTQSTDASGDKGGLYVCRNYRVSFGKPRMHDVQAVPPPRGAYTGSTVKVAVLDTGVDTTEMKNFLNHSAWPACIPTAERGYNLIQLNNNFQDNNDMRYGTVVARFIADQVVKYGRNPAEFLIVKTHGRNGVGSLTGLLCAFAYAKTWGADIINASLGFYTPRLEKLNHDQYPLDPNVILLREYVRHYLIENKILMVTAAGNRDDINEKKAFDDQGISFYPKDHRSLDAVSFYPGSLAGQPGFENVIAVTTVNKAGNTVSPDQNYSPDVVDIGVKCDGTVPDPVSGAPMFVFNNPRLNGVIKQDADSYAMQTVNGSSFAAAIVTGKLCAFYDKIKDHVSNKNFRKDDLWNALGPDITYSNPALNNKIRGGRVMDK